MRLSKFSLFLILAFSFSSVPLPAALRFPFKAYQVSAGDSLWKIAARPDVYGDPWKWPLLLDSNPERIADADHLKIGWRLKVQIAPTLAEVAAATARARQYGENGALAPDLDGPALDDVAAAGPGRGPEAVPRVDPRLLGALLVAGLLIWSALTLLAYALATRLFLAHNGLDTPVLKPRPQPTESEAILRAQDGPDPLHHWPQPSETEHEDLAA